VTVRWPVISAIGISQHQLWLIWLGSGIIGGLGLGLGYISPVSTLIKWFPDRRGVATGMAIMGFGGGAMIGPPLAQKLIVHFATPASVGVVETFLVLATIYIVFMVSGAPGYRLPPPNWKPAGWNADMVRKPLITQHEVALNTAPRTPQFWLVWLVLMLNVSAGIGTLSMPSPLLQEVFGGRLIGVTASFDQLNTQQLAAIAALAAAFTGLLSLFNIAGRIFWASMSYHMGGKMTYMPSSCWASCCTPRSPGQPPPETWHCSWASSASSCRCMEGASRPCPLTFRISSAPRWSARSTDGF